MRSLCWCLVLVLAGCGSGSGPSRGKLVPVKGKVTVAGRLLAEGYVQYYPLGGDEKAPFSEGKIQADGTYSLSTQGKPGAPVGKYRVTVDPGGDKEVTQLFDVAYSSHVRSPLEKEVVEGSPVGGYDLDLPARQQE